MSFLLAADEAPVFKGATLVVADVSRGNVGQLAADLLITTMQMTRVGYFDDPDVLPAVGMENGKLSVNTELFAAQDSSLFVLQQRSPAVASHEGAYGQRMAAWIRKSAFAKVLLLSSLPAEMRKDQQLSGGPQMTAGVCGSAGEAQTRAQTLGWRCVSFAADVPMTEEVEWMHQAIVRTEATPLSSSLLQHLGGEASGGGGNVICMFAWCAEGDNLPDGIQMASWVNDYLAVLTPNEQGQVGWKVPESWRIVMAQNAPRPVYT
mmetsp:Transcript_70671/g.103573  ORF Transcript_70671/g.103573 Transcript_70671/m.103573 type:complete len:263 (+) Transcript_70671:64-852(+)